MRYMHAIYPITMETEWWTSRDLLCANWYDLTKVESEEQISNFLEGLDCFGEHGKTILNGAMRESKKFAYDHVIGAINRSSWSYQYIEYLNFYASSSNS